jgi:CheY-like chemotaxis protein
MNAVCRILVVEDAHVIREPLSRLLKLEGFDVTSAADGNEAMALLEAPQARAVDLVLLDVMMPRMNGVRFLEALRQDHRFARLPVIALTGISDTTQLRRLRELRVSAIVHKIRFRFDELVDEIRRHVPEKSPGGV